MSNYLAFRLVREEFTDESTVGKLYFSLSDRDPWTWLCWTLEDVVREAPGQPVEAWKIPGETAIPRGTYAVRVTRSSRFKADLPILLNVPGFEGIRIHGGNTAADTEGCILVAHHHPREDVIQGKATAEVLAILATCGNSGMITICDKGQA
jgi:hypothetical protein